MTDPDEQLVYDAYADSSTPVANRAENLRLLLTELYVGILGALYDVPGLASDSAAIDRVLTSVLDAAEGRPFRPIGLPWPETSRNGGDPQLDDR